MREPFNRTVSLTARVAILLCLFPADRLITALADSTGKNLMAKTTNGNYPVIEFRRYTIHEGQRDNFARRFESYFPEAIQQTGAIVAGEFLERANRDVFTWIRGFHNMDDRARLNGELYYGPVWMEHRDQMNDLLVDSDNVLLLHAIDAQHGLMILPALDPAREDAAHGVVVAQIFKFKAGDETALLQRAEPSFAQYRAAGAREAGVLVTLDEHNNFPQLPVRTDGPYLVWLGIVNDNQTLESRFHAVAEQAARALSETGLLREQPETIILDPAPRSRMRWMSDWQ